MFWGPSPGSARSLSHQMSQAAVCMAASAVVPIWTKGQPAMVILCLAFCILKRYMNHHLDIHCDFKSHRPILFLPKEATATLTYPMI